MRSVFRPAVLAGCALALAACAEGAKPRAPLNPDPAANTYAPALGVTLSQFKKLPSGVYVRDDSVGTGAAVAAGQRLRMDYTGWLADGTKFDSSLDGGEPYPFTLGQGEVIRGWDEGVVGMKVGGVRTLVIPARMGYGSTGSPPTIPPYAVLVFRVKLRGVG